MKKVFLAVLLALTLASSTSFAKGEKFPDKGWHKGFYITVMGGMTQASVDTNVDTNRKFDGTIIPAVGLNMGWDIADWIGPYLQMQYGFATDTVGDGTVNHPIENAREHMIHFRLGARATVPYFLYADWQPNKIKIIPFARLGGVGTALYVNAPTAANKVGAWGGGATIGLGLETLIIDRIVLGLEAMEDLMFMQNYYRTIAGARTQIIRGGFKPMFTLMGTVGYHF